MQERFVFLDETAATTAMTRLYGWAPKGERLVDAAPAGHWKTTTFVAGLRSRGLIAPLVLDGPMTGRSSEPMSSRCSLRLSSLVMWS
jgi:hypothetical protein